MIPSRPAIASTRAMTQRITAGQCALVLVNFNNAPDTLLCLEAIYGLRHAPACIVVVDNGSEHLEQERLFVGWRTLAARLGQATPEARAGSPGVADLGPALFVSLGENRGFSGGNNAALRLLLTDGAHSKVRAAWLLNNDAIPRPDALDALCRRLDETGAAICGSTLLHMDMPQEVQAAGGSTFDPWTGRTAFLCGRQPLETVREASPENVERRMAYVVGASMLVRCETFAAAGLLPEEYFLYYEDTAFGLAVRKAGLKLAWAPRSEVLHKEGGSTKATSGPVTGIRHSVTMDCFTLRNRFYLLRHYHPFRLPVALLSLAGVLYLRVCRGQIRRIPALLGAIMDGLRGRMGPHTRA